MKTLAAVAVAVVALFVLSAEVRAEENATIVNETNVQVAFHAHWSHLGYESSRIVLTPGDSYKFSGPNGSVLRIRFDATPLVPVWENQVSRVMTAPGVPPWHPGHFNVFRWSLVPGRIDLFR